MDFDAQIQEELENMDFGGGAVDVGRLYNIAKRPADLAYDSMEGALHLVGHSWLEHREDSSRHFKGMNAHALTMALYSRLNDVETLYKRELDNGKTTHVFRKWLDVRAYDVCDENNWHSMDLHEWFDAKYQLLEGKRDKWLGLHKDMARRLHVKRVGVVPGWIQQHYADFMQHLNLQERQKVCFVAIILRKVWLSWLDFDCAQNAGCAHAAAVPEFFSLSSGAL